ncbi:potassium voltage-gated channel subfamily E member 4 [Manis pentadactyla]|uniref:potassium voltage-gated channel subfamily E member 4 n=1 Tax=Manis pentadactyla TaxID=143292 RepID=UPI0018768D9A|nr:potassium voltage-gated channel subfamily E member 4 [Manis pentadactyla]
MHVLTIYPNRSPRIVRTRSPRRGRALLDQPFRNSGLGANSPAFDSGCVSSASMLKMEPLNSTQPSTAAPGSPLESQVPGSRSGNGNEYFYILVVMSFYGVFLIGIMLGYMKSKRREKKSSLLLLYKDEERLWGEAMKPLPTVSGLRSVQVPMMFNMLQESVAPALSCTLCSMEGDSLSSESSSPDVHLTIQEEGADDELEESSETPPNESSEGSSENIHQNS